jgi:hypothetical protein
LPTHVGYHPDNDKKTDVDACRLSADFVAEVGAQCRGILNRLFFEVVGL